MQDFARIKHTHHINNMDSNRTTDEDEDNTRRKQRYDKQENRDDTLHETHDISTDAQCLELQLVGPRRDHAQTYVKERCDPALYADNRLQLYSWQQQDSNNRHSSANGEVRHNAQDTDDYDDDDQYLNLTIDVSVSPAERRKDLSQVLARINLILHDLDWSSYWSYASDLMQTTSEHRKLDYYACIQLHKCYILRVTSGAWTALQALENSWESIQKAPSGSFLQVRFLAMRAFLLYFLGRQDEARSCHEDATHISASLEANNPSALNLYYFALNSVLHNRQEWDKVSGIPVENAWQKAAAAYWNACGQNKSWVTDLEEDPKVGEAEMDFFFVLTFIKYIMCLLRTCAAPEGFYRLMAKEHGVTKYTLRTVKCYVAKADNHAKNMFPRTLIYYYLAKCDYYIRSYQNKFENKNKCLTEAKKFAVLARDLPATFKQAKLGRFVREFGLCRLAYIEKLLKGQNIDDYADNEETDSAVEFEDSLMNPGEPHTYSHGGSIANSGSEPHSHAGSNDGSTLDSGITNLSLNDRGSICPRQRTHFTPLVISGEMSHMDVFKKKQDNEDSCRLEDDRLSKILKETTPKERIAGYES